MKKKQVSSKLFFVKDNSGREFTANNVTLADLLKWDNDTDDDGIKLHTWARKAESGDRWEDSDTATEITCTQS